MNCNLLHSRQNVLELITVAQSTGRYVDMICGIKILIHSGLELTELERNLFFIAYKNLINIHRIHFDTIEKIKNNSGNHSCKRTVAAYYKKQIFSEYKLICDEVLFLLDYYLLPKTNSEIARIFYLKMRGDYFRYLALYSDTSSLKIYVVKGSRFSYEDAMKRASALLPATDPLRLSIVLNFAALYRDILNSDDMCYNISKQTLNNVNWQLATCKQFKIEQESLVIISRLQKNIEWYEGQNKRGDLPFCMS